MIDKRKIGVLDFCESCVIGEAQDIASTSEDMIQVKLSGMYMLIYGDL